MRFEQALQAMREGKKVTRRIGSLLEYEIVDNKIVSRLVNSYGEKICRAIAVIACSDIMSENWEIVEDEQ